MSKKNGNLLKTAKMEDGYSKIKKYIVETLQSRLKMKMHSLYGSFNANALGRN